MVILGAPRIRLPQSLIEQMIQAGAVKEAASGEEDICILRIVDGVGSRAWSLYQRWASELGEVDPIVLGVFNPSQAILGTASVPNPALLWPLNREVHSIMTHYAPLDIQAFAAGAPVIPGPLVAMQIPINIHHATVAVCGLIEGIQRPPAAYPTINGLGAGSYIYDVVYYWSAAVVTVSIFKPA